MTDLNIPTENRAPAFVVAYYFPHNDYDPDEGIPQGIIDGPGFDSKSMFVDLYEVDGQIRSFATREEAQTWLDGLSYDKGDDDDDDESGWGVDGD